MGKLASWALTWVAVAGLTFEIPKANAQIPTVQTSTVTVEECRNLSDTEVRDRIRDLASTILKSEFGKIDYAALVNAYWAKTGVNARVDREIDLAVADVRSNTGWFDRAYSTVSTSSAKRYATAVADKAYNSEGFKQALEDMAKGVATDAGQQIERATQQVANPVITCVQTALQTRYGGAIAAVFAQESQKNLETDKAGPVRIDTSDLVLNNTASISGIVLIVTRRVIARVVQSIGRRIAGVVASRIASLVATVVGVVLIAKDLYEAGDGVFPLIADRMKADETKQLIKDEIGKSIQSEITQQVGTIAQETSERIYTVWLDFKQKYARLLALSEKFPTFKEFLRDRRLEQLGSLGRIVDIILGSESEERLVQRVADGSLNKALIDLTEPGLAIAAEQKSIDKALRWTELAGRELPRVVELGIFRWLSPEGLTPQTLQKLLGLNDKIAVNRIASLEPQSREYVLALPLEQLRDFARRLSDQQLAAFADYQRRLDPAAARRLLRAVTEDPRVMQSLSGNGLREAVVGSRDQLAALDILLHDETSLISYGRILKDAELVQNGVVNYRVFWDRYWPSLLLAAFVLLLLLSWLRRLIFGRPPVVIRDHGSRRR